MSRTALIVVCSLVFLAPLQAIQAQDPSHDPVAKIFLDQLGLKVEPGTKPELELWAKRMDQAQKDAARKGLEKLEVRTQDESVLSQIARGYAALSSPQDSARVLTLLHGAHEKAALAAQMLAEERVPDREIKSLPKRRDKSVQTGTDGSPAGEDAILTGPAPKRKGILPPLNVYHMPDTKPPGTWDTIKMGVGSLWKFYRHKPTREETEAIRGLKDRLDDLPTGDELVRRMGGWDKIDKEVYFMYSDMPEGGTLAYVRPLAPWEEKRTGKKYLLAVNKKFIKSEPAAILPVFGHELSHVADKMEGRSSHQLAVTSEHGAHLRQVYLFQEVRDRLSEQEREKLQEDRVWMYQRWVTSMWEDHLLKLYPKKEDYQKSFEGSKNLAYLAGLAYDDIAKKAVGDGTPQVLYHVSDLYAAATHEPEVDEEGLRRAIRDEPDASHRRQLEKMLDDLLAMRRLMFESDTSYRIRTRQTIP